VLRVLLIVAGVMAFLSVPGFFFALEDRSASARIFLSPGAPQDRPWMWASGHNGYTPRGARL
jgi:hypothetical protein